MIKSRVQEFHKVSQVKGPTNKKEWHLLKKHSGKQLCPYLKINLDIHRWIFLNTFYFAQKILSYRWESIKKEEASKTFDQIWEPSEKVMIMMMMTTIVMMTMIMMVMMMMISEKVKV